MVEAASDHELKALRNRNPVLRASIHETLDRLFKRACLILSENRAVLDEAADQLADTLFLTPQELEDMIGDRSEFPLSTLGIDVGSPST